MTTDNATPDQAGDRRRKKRALWLVAAGAAIWLGFAVRDFLGEPTFPPAPKALKGLALRHLQAESRNAFWTGGAPK